MLAPPEQRPPGLFKRLYDAVARPPAARPYTEQGVSGTAVYSGYVQVPEKSPKWVGRQKYVTIADMAVNTSVIAAGVHYFLNLIAHPQWTIAPADEDDDEAKAAAEFVEECLHGMEVPWSRVVRRTGTYRYYGYGIQEWTAVRRPDGRIGLRSIEPRPQHTIEQWVVADDGAVEGVWQRHPKTGALLGIPRKKFLYLVDDVLTDSPEGTGLFRHLAESWERLKVYYDLEARAFERDLRGIPVGRVPFSLLNEAVENGDLTAAKRDQMVDALEKFVQMQVKQSDSAIMLDSVPYYSQAADGAKVASVPQWGMELLQGSATGVEAVSEAIKRTSLEMARLLSTEHQMMGESAGNRSLAEDKSRGLALVGDAMLGDMAAAVDHDVIAHLCDLNGIPEEYRPHAEVESVSFKDAEAIAATLEKMANAGAVLAPDDPVNEDVRSLMGVSAPSQVATEMAGLTEDDGTADAGTEMADEPAVDPDTGEPVAKAGKRTLYVRRRLLNGDAVRAWAAGQGLASALPADDMHVTVAFSREPVDWSALRPDEQTFVELGGSTRVHQFPPRTTPNGALVLRFASPGLTSRWQYYRDGGASWDFPEYAPHVTLTYSVPDASAMDITPYAGPLLFGPEEWSEVNEDWAGNLKETPLRKGIARRRRM